MRGFLMCTIFGPEREGISTAELWRQLSIRERAKVRSDDEGPLTITRLRDELEVLRERGDIRSEEVDGEEVWRPSYRAEKVLEREKQAELFT